MVGFTETGLEKVPRLESRCHLQDVSITMTEDSEGGRLSLPLLITGERFVFGGLGEPSVSQLGCCRPPCLPIVLRTLSSSEGRCDPMPQEDEYRSTSWSTEGD